MSSRSRWCSRIHAVRQTPHFVVDLGRPFDGHAVRAQQRDRCRVQIVARRDHVDHATGQAETLLAGHRHRDGIAVVCRTLAVRFEIDATAKVAFRDHVPAARAGDRASDHRFLRACSHRRDHRLTFDEPRVHGIADAQPRVARQPHRQCVAAGGRYQHQTTAVTATDHAVDRRLGRRQLISAAAVDVQVAGMAQASQHAPQLIDVAALAHAREFANFGPAHRFLLRAKHLDDRRRRQQNGAFVDVAACLRTNGFTAALAFFCHVDNPGIGA